MTRRIPKSLHTITALARVAQHLMTEQDFSQWVDPQTAAVNVAATLLGYPVGSTDPDGLKERAVATLKASA